MTRYYEECHNSFHDDPYEYRDNCPECDGFERRGLVPVVGCGVVEGSREQAAERMARYEYENNYRHNPDRARWEKAPDKIRQAYIDWATPRLAAALGEQENR